MEVAMVDDALTPEERERHIRGLAAMAKWADWDTRRPWLDFDSDPGCCPAITTALVEHYIASDIPISDVRRELLELTAREDQRLGDLPSYRPEEDDE
jgi:hypothetical protein